MLFLFFRLLKLPRDNLSPPRRNPYKLGIFKLISSKYKLIVAQRQQYLSNSCHSVTISSNQRGNTMNSLTKPLTAQQEAAIYSKFSPRPTIKREPRVKRDLPEYLITMSFFTFSLSMLALLAAPIIALFL